MKKIITLSLFILSNAIYGNAQETLDLNTAIRTAIRNNNTVSTLEKSLEIQKLSTKTSRGNLFPSLSLSASWSRNNTFSEGSTRFENGVPITLSKQNTWLSNFGLGLNSQVVLFNGFSNYEQIDLSRENETAAIISLDKEKYDIIFRVTAAYFDLLKKDKIVLANKDNLKDSQIQLDRIKEFMNVGKRTIADVYKQDVQVAQNELATERSINELNKSKVDLLFAMNDDMNRDFNISESSVDINLTESDLQTILDRNSNTEVLLNRALEKRYDYKSSLQDIKINQVQLNIDNKNLYFPTISAFSNYNLNSSKIGDITDSRTFSFGLQLSYSIFQGFKLDTKRQTTEINIKQKRDLLAQLQQQIRSEIRKSYLDLQTAKKQIEILNRNIISAEQDKLLSEENYRVGVGTLIDVQTASTKLNTLKIDRINAYYDFLLAERKLIYYTGDLSY
ncbi:MAG: TolC family protein [Bacteroidetes bacterium]|nr:TolC family protein [Bacteroidota bacterium]